MPNNINLHENLLNKLSDLQQIQKTGDQKKISEAKVKFEDVLKEFIGDVNNLQSTAKESIEKLAAGEITDVHQVMVASEKAGVAFDLMMEIRNKMLEAYQEIMRMQV